MTENWSYTTNVWRFVDPWYTRAPLGASALLIAVMFMVVGLALIRYGR